LVTGVPAGTTTGSEATGETKVTDLELAVSIDEQVSRLEIPMENVGGVNILETT
jgi:hypothetical protein